MRLKIIKIIAVVLTIGVSGVLYSCQDMPDGGVDFEVIESETTGGIFVESEVDIKSEDNNNQSVTAKGNEESESLKSETVCVYVCGAVVREGVYILNSSQRIEAAIMAAGGFADDADTSAINLAEFMTDGQQIDVPSVDEVSALADQTQECGLLDINRASEAELMTLPGIGSAKAKQIIAYRQANGPFSSVDELKQVPGIKNGVFEALKTFICAG